MVMVNGPADWRDDSAYDYVDGLNASDMGWEFLRRNADYRRDYAAISKEEAPDTRIEAVCRFWGLRFPDRPGPAGL